MKYLAIFLILFTAPAYGAEIRCAAMSTASGTSTANANALNSCIAAALNEPEKTVVIPAASGIYRIDSIFQIPEGITIKGEISGSLISKVFTLFDVRSNATVENIVFDNNWRSIIIGFNSVQTGVTIKDCTFGHSAVLDSSGTNPQPGFPWSSIIAYRMSDSTIDNNTFINQEKKYPNGTASGQNISMVCGKRNQVTNNYVWGGKTSIIFRPSWTICGPDLQVWDNYVGGNEVHRALEEGISFDVIGNDGAQVSAFEIDFIASVGTHSVTLQHANWVGTLEDYTGYNLVFVNGNLKGQTRVILSHSGNSFTFSESVSGATVGDQVVIGMIFKGNVIDNNTVRYRSSSSILLFGMAFNNRIINNDTDGGISVRSLDDLRKRIPTVTNTCGRAPSGYNLVQGNTIGQNLWFHFRDNTTERDPWPCINTGYPLGDPHYSYGNTGIDNTIGGIIGANYQHIFLSGNTYSGTDFTNTTLLDANPIGDYEPVIPEFPGFPTYVNIVDDFNRADGALGADWTSPIGSFAISSNRAVGTTTDNNSIYNVTSYTDFEFHATIANHSLSYGLYFRTTLDREYGYYLGTHGTGYLRLRRFWNTWANSADIGEYIPVTIATGHKIGVRAVGDNFTIWHDPGTGWVQIATRTDSTYASGYVGMVSHNTSMAFDDFGIVSPMVGFPGFGILDEFNRADGALGSNWSVEEGTVAIATNKVAASTTESAALWFQTFTDCEAYMTLSTVAQDETATLFLRATEDQGYAVTFTSDAVEQTINIYARHDGWTDTTLVGTDTVAIANAGDKIGARVSDTTSGSTITVFYDSGNGWQEIFSEIDTNYASGKVGFGINENAAGVPVTTLDDFGGGGVATYGPGVTEPNIGRHRTPGIGIVYNPRGIGIR